MNSSEEAIESEKTFEHLRKLLLEDEQREHKQLTQQVVELREDINTRQRLQQKVDPIIDDKLTYLREHFPELFGSVLTRAIKRQIQESRGEVIDALYPIMGKLIKKYIVVELNVLSEKIDQQLDQAFSWDMWKRRLRAWVTGQSLGKEIIAQTMQPTIQEVFIIEQHSSVLLGSYSHQNIMDRDMIAGMMTALRGFAKEAFAKEHQDLQTVEYETYKILLKNFQTFYVAVTVSGVINEAFKQHADDLILDFVHKVVNATPDAKNNNDYLSEPLRLYFSQTGS
ncbi:hypothetical protein [Tunicatimonas pelagia]|uniref:hypothetical protein n=1 Tax=Tunicatimonas pelagia TaxID=931531 RepID=UPI00266715B6|nr:hypothetical protein [Tunicatimonas pelagia]WKN44759.1 hypothetical protein P0M28_07250 [Tunicatimonas pelagia]